MRLTIEDLYPFLEKLTQPALHLKQDRFIWVNPAARRVLLLPELSVQALLGEEAYAAYCAAPAQSELNLPLRCGQCAYTAAVTRYADGDLFLLRQEQENLSFSALFNIATALRAPLSDILTSAQVLFPYLEEQENEFIQSCTASLNRSFYRLVRAVAMMGDASAMELGDLRLDAERTELCDFVHTVGEKARPFCEELGVELEIVLPDKLFFGRVDRDKLERAVFNLLSNALKYTSSGGKVTLRLRRNGNLGLLRVSDSGGGVESGVLQDAAARSAQNGPDPLWGVGLGLQIARAIARLHGGNLMLESVPGQGTAVSLSFRLEPAEEAPVLSPAERYDYAGGLDHAHLEFADVMPNAAYDTRCI